MEKMCLKKVSSKASLHSLRRLALVETFCYGSIFCMSRDKAPSRFSQSLYQMDFMDTLLCGNVFGRKLLRGAPHSLLPEYGLYTGWIKSRVTTVNNR